MSARSSLEVKVPVTSRAARLSSISSSVALTSALAVMASKVPSRSRVIVPPEIAAGAISLLTSAVSRNVVVRESLTASSAGLTVPLALTCNTAFSTSAEVSVTSVVSVS